MVQWLRLHSQCRGPCVRSLVRELDPTWRNTDSTCHNQDAAQPNKFKQTKKTEHLPSDRPLTYLADISVARPSRTLNKQVAELSSGKVGPTSISTLSKLLADLFFHPGRTMPLLFKQPPCVRTNSLNLCPLKYESSFINPKAVERALMPGGSIFFERREYFEN